MRLRPASPTDYERIITVVDDWWGREVHHVLPRLFLDHFTATPAPSHDGPNTDRVLFHRAWR